MTIKIPPFSRVKQLSRLLDIPSPKVVKEICQRHRRSLYCQVEDRWFRFKSPADVIVPYVVAATLARRNGSEVEMDPMQPRLSSRKSIPSVVLVGHFNHGKTTLLDRLGGSHIAAQETHGITQVVRSRSVSLSDSVLSTFIDTPGQDIFYRMRNCGAAVADLAVLVVAADEGVCEQTKECIGIVESLRLPVVVAITKVDLSEVVCKTSLLKQLEEELREYVALEYAPIVHVSAMSEATLDRLREAVLRVVGTLDGIGPPPPEEALRTGLGAPCASGTALNVWRDRHHGTVLHLILLAGVVRVRDAFSGGGWWVPVLAA